MFNFKKIITTVLLITSCSEEMPTKQSLLKDNASELGGTITVSHTYWCFQSHEIGNFGKAVGILHQASRGIHE